MNAKAISFTPEVLKVKLRALEKYGRCMTRRPVRRDWMQSLGEPDCWEPASNGTFRAFDHMENEMRRFGGPLGIVGDRLWVRERARVVGAYGSAEDDSVRAVALRYELDGEERAVPWPARLKAPVEGRCIPNGVHREGARHFLEVVEVRAERVVEISEQDARLEGMSLDNSAPPGFLDCRNLDPTTSYSTNFFALYDSIYGAGAHSRDWCWVYTLKRGAP